MQHIRMRVRQILFTVGVLITFFPIVKLSLSLNHPAFFIAYGIAVFLVLLTVFRCPHCGHLAFLTKHGVNTPFVRSKCRDCGKDY